MMDIPTPLDLKAIESRVRDGYGVDERSVQARLDVIMLLAALRETRAALIGLLRDVGPSGAPILRLEASRAVLAKVRDE